MGKEVLTFGDIDIEKDKFYCHRSPTFFEKYRYWWSVSIRKDFFCWKNYKYFISYFYNDYKVKQLHIMLPKTSAYVKNYDVQTKWMYFFIEDDG